MAEKATPSAQPDLRGLAERLDGLQSALWADSDALRSGREEPEVIAEGMRKAARRLLQLIRELRAALAGPEDGARSAWRPIQEPPEDGTPVLVYRAGDRGFRHVIARRYRQVWFSSGTTQLTADPVAWMPLPPPPVAAARPSGEQEGQ